MIHLFQISDIGVYCRSITELNTFNALHRITKSNKAIKFWIPPEDESVGAIIEIDGYRKKYCFCFIQRAVKNFHIIQIYMFHLLLIVLCLSLKNICIHLFSSTFFQIYYI